MTTPKRTDKEYGETILGAMRKDNPTVPFTLDKDGTHVGYWKDGRWNLYAGYAPAFAGFGSTPPRPAEWVHPVGDLFDGDKCLTDAEWPPPPN